MFLCFEHVLCLCALKAVNQSKSVHIDLLLLGNTFQVLEDVEWHLENCGSKEGLQVRSCNFVPLSGHDKGRLAGFDCV